MKYQITITLVNCRDIDFIKFIRTIGHQDLKLSNDIASYIKSHYPATLIAGIEKEKGQQILQDLNELDVDARIEESSVQSPCMISPQSISRYKWGRFNTLTKEN